ncbi:MAG TPA: hypothetical protein VE130_10585 [Nitrososphaeraceae archaeon]|nr:hypothetical protein [Nitrososphaeraceae archaeon]
MNYKLSVGLLAVGIVAIMTVAIAPIMSANIHAVKTEQERKCTQDPGGDKGEDCGGQSAEHNKNREQQECDVTAGSQDHRVQGQYKKLCEE